MMWRRLLTFVIKVSKNIVCLLMLLINRKKKYSWKISGYHNITMLYSFLNLLNTSTSCLCKHVSWLENRRAVIPLKDWKRKRTERF